MTTRPVHQKLSPTIATTITDYHANVITEIANHVQQDEIVVVGMAWNPFVKRACNLLKSHNQPFTYLEYGSYVSQWKPRLAIKMWSGWPTFPQVFVKGALVGGFTDLKDLVDSNRLEEMLKDNS